MSSTEDETEVCREKSEAWELQILLQTEAQSGLTAEGLHEGSPEPH